MQRFTTDFVDLGRRGGWKFGQVLTRCADSDEADGCFLGGRVVVLFRRQHHDSGDNQHRETTAAPTTGARVTNAPTINDQRIEDIVRDRLVSAVFQPIVHLDSGAVVGYEALCRGPTGSPFQSAGPMFAAAETAGLAAELDLVAHAAAFTAAVQAELHPATSLFINVSQHGLSGTVPDDLAPALSLARARLRIFVEMSERSLSADARGTLLGVDRARRAGWGIALDNVGVNPASLALLPFARPDVVKIDVSLIHEQAHPHAARVMNAVTAHAERTGASIMAVGVETAAHLGTARGLGATLAQGYHFGRPGPLPERSTVSPFAISILPQPTPAAPDATPFTIATQHGAPVRATGDVLQILAGHLEQRVSLDPDPIVVLSCLPADRMLSGAPLAMLQMLARNASYIAALVTEIPRHPIPDVFLAPLPPGDPLREEPTLLLIGPHYSAILTARHADGNDYDYRLVYDRTTVEQVAQTLIHRINPPRG